MVPGRVPHGPAARGPGRAGLRQHPARRARRGWPGPPAGGWLAVPGHRLAAGADHQRRRLRAGPAIRPVSSAPYTALATSARYTALATSARYTALAALTGLAA